MVIFNSSATQGVGTNTFEELSHPLGHLYLAGEGYIFGLHSSVHGALVHGSKVAERIMWEILGPLTGKPVSYTHLTLPTIYSV